jgi:hypothetical protein
MPMTDTGQIADLKHIREHGLKCPGGSLDIASLPKHTLPLFPQPEEDQYDHP